MARYLYMILRFFILEVLLAAASYAAPTVTKVEPPNWWVHHTLNPIQVLLTGSDLTGATVTSATKGLRIEVRRTSDNGTYLFAYLTIDPSVKPGKYRFQLKSAAGAGGFDFALERPSIPRAASRVSPPTM